MSFKNITLEEAQQLIEQGAIIADIRDPESFAQGHIENSLHLSNENVADFVREQDLDKPLIVCCYHGHSSQPAAQYLSEQGFDDVYSLIGGYTAWSTSAHLKESDKR